MSYEAEFQSKPTSTSTSRWMHQANCLTSGGVSPSTGSPSTGLLPLVPPPLVPLSTGFPSNISSTQLRPSPVPVQPDWFQTGLEFSSCLSSQQRLCHDSSAKHAEHLSSSRARGRAPLAGLRLRSVGSKVRGASWGPEPRLQTWSMTL